MFKVELGLNLELDIYEKNIKVKLGLKLKLKVF